MPRVLNKKYWPHQTTLDSVDAYANDTDVKVIDDWCRENIGSLKWYRYDNTYCFNNDHDQTVFLLRWT